MLKKILLLMCTSLFFYLNAQDPSIELLNKTFSISTNEQENTQATDTDTPNDTDDLDDEEETYVSPDNLYNYD